MFVKRGDPSPASEARTQAYAFEQARSHGRAPSVPRVDGVFYDEAGSTYLVMEHVDASSFRAWVDEPGPSAAEREIRTTTAVAAIANTIALLLWSAPLREETRSAPWAEDASSTSSSVWRRPQSRLSMPPPWRNT